MAGIGAHVGQGVKLKLSLHKDEWQVDRMNGKWIGRDSAGVSSAQADHFDPKPREPPPLLELRCEVLRCLPYAVLRDGLLAAGLTTQVDREALVQSLARVWKCAAARQRRYLLFLFRRIHARPEWNIEGSISVHVWIERNDPRRIGGHASTICTLASEQAIVWRGVMDTSLFLVHRRTWQ